MLLTQRAVFADLQGYVGLTATELPDAAATAILLKAFDEMFVLFDKAALFFDDSEAVKQRVQKEAEVLLACYYYYYEYGPKKLLVDFETYGRPVASTLSLGGFKVGEKGGGKQGVLSWYQQQARIAKDLYGQKINTLLRGETTPVLESNYR